MRERRKGKGGRFQLRLRLQPGQLHALCLLWRRRTPASRGECGRRGMRLGVIMMGYEGIKTAAWHVPALEDKSCEVCVCCVMSLI